MNDKKLIEKMCDAVEAHLHQHGHNARRKPHDNPRHPPPHHPHPKNR